MSKRSHIDIHGRNSQGSKKVARREHVSAHLSDCSKSFTRGVKEIRLDEGRQSISFLCATANVHRKSLR